MRILVQRVANASVTIDSNVYSNISQGLLVFVGIENADENSDIEWLVSKILNLRIFNDSNGVMNLSVTDILGEILVISQFTLHAATKKGNRPSYINAAKPDIAIKTYNSFVDYLKKSTTLNVKTGVFGADMKVQLLNDGPVTIFIDSKNRE